MTRKLADKLDGIDVSSYREGDVLDVASADADVLIAERWAVPFGLSGGLRTATVCNRAVAADRSGRPTVEQLRRIREATEITRVRYRQSRRAEDRIREELHDSRAKTIRRRS